MIKRGLLLFSIVSLLLCTGCWSQEEPKTLAIISSVLYDIKEDGQYKVVAEIMRSSSAGSSESSMAAGKQIYTSVGEGPLSAKR